MLYRLIRDRRGNFTVLSAILLTGMAGVAGLVADYGSGLYSRVEDQRMADLAAMAGATVYAQTNSSSSMTTAVSNIASLNGYSSSNVTPTLVSSPTGDGNQAVRVVVNSTVPLTFSRLITSNSSASVSGSSYAELKHTSGSACVLALDPTASQAFTISGSGNLQAPTCDVIANSNNSTDALDMSGSAQINAACTITVGGQKTTSGLTLDVCQTPTTGATATSDPYASVPTPTAGASCLTLPNPPINVVHGYYCHGINVSTTATFQQGTYLVQGNLAFQGGSNVTAHNVTFYVTGGTVAISGSATVDLTAQNSGTYAGILFFGSRSGNLSNNNNISGSSSSTITGALYFPTQQISFTGGSNTPSACTQVIGDKVTISGTAYLSDSCAGTGVSSITPTGSLKAALVQ